ncbi:hypothetical protein D3C87_125720 [compost metagenome]
MKFVVGIFVFLSSLVATAAETCDAEFDGLPVCVQVDFTKGPVNRDESQFAVRFLNTEDGTAVDPQGLKIDLWMQMGRHGHGTAPVKIERQDAGVYFVSEAYFVMPGQWQVRFFAQDAQGAEKTTEVIVDVPGKH